ncbi:MAG: hypothetical protein Q4B73_06130 [Lachnospiraceae bacterium]|nr:hypothetical protein [Lachnospiraceae bacterium]
MIKTHKAGRNGRHRLTRMLAGVLLAATLMTTPIFTGEAAAYDYDMASMQMLNRELNGKQDTSNIAAWIQGRVPYAGTRALRAGESDSTVVSGACSYWAAAYMLAKMGQLDVLNGENPMTVLDRAEAIKGWLTFGKMDYTRINEIWPDVTCHGYKRRFPSSDFNKQLAFIQDLMDQGYFVIICIDGINNNGHYIFADSVTEDGDLVIGDSAYEGTMWSDTHGPQASFFVDYSIFTCKDVMPADTPSIYDFNLQANGRMEGSGYGIDFSQHEGTHTAIQWLLNSQGPAETNLPDWIKRTVGKS